MRNRVLVALLAAFTLLGLTGVARASSPVVAIRVVSVAQMQAVAQNTADPCGQFVQGNFVAAAVPAYVHADEVGWRGATPDGLVPAYPFLQTSGNGQPMQIRQTPFPAKATFQAVQTWFQSRQTRYDLWAPLAGSCSTWVHYIAQG